MAIADLVKLRPHDLTFCTWHESSPLLRAQLRAWVGGMKSDRDGEEGSGPNGAGAWLDEEIARSRPGGLFQSFLGVYDGEVVWTGSVVENDRGVREQLAEMGFLVGAFFGLFNTRFDLRGRGIGWAGVQHVMDFVQTCDRSMRPASIALFTANPAAERHYRAAGFRLVCETHIAAFDAVERVYIWVDASSAEPDHPSDDAA